ncbi:hypothetical protein [Saccharopolyspora sp. NPDC049357]|uniref:hypothetical protein n=1 Tax=Saccharopolyspora sp. NPDC049357 TaxID=3154507 RepID=UPI0034471F61
MGERAVLTHVRAAAGPRVRGRTVTRGLRGPRALMLALCSGALGVGSHAAAGGGLPHFSVLLPLVIGVSVVGLPLAEKRESGRVMLAMIGGSQALMHVFLTITGHHAHAAPQDDAGGPAMVAGHVVATLATGLLLARADRLLIAAWNALNAVLFVLMPLRSAPARAVRLWTACTEPAALQGVELLRVSPKRGPPLSLMNG